MRNPLFVSILLFLVSCVSQEEQAGANDIAAVFQAESVTISKGVERSTSEESIDYLGIEIINPQGILNKETTLEEVVNLASLILYRKLTPETKQEKNAIKVTVKTNTSEGQQEFSRTNLFKNLEQADQSMAALDQFSEGLMKKDYQKSYSYFADNIVEQAPKDSLIFSLQQVSTNYGEIKSYKFTNFEVTKTKNDKDEEVNVVVVKGYFEKDTVYNPVEFVMYKNKIAGFEF